MVSSAHPCVNVCSYPPLCILPHPSPVNPFSCICILPSVSRISSFNLLSSLWQLFLLLQVLSPSLHPYPYTRHPYTHKAPPMYTQIPMYTSFPMYTFFITESFLSSISPFSSSYVDCLPPVIHTHTSDIRIYIERHLCMHRLPCIHTFPCILYAVILSIFSSFILSPFPFLLCILSASFHAYIHT